MDVFLRLITYIRPYLGRAIIGIGATLVVIALEAVQPLLMREVIDNILTPYFSDGHYSGGDFLDERIASDFDLLQFYALILLGIYILRTFFGFINRYLLNRVGQEILFGLRVQVYDHLQHLGLRFYNDRSTGELMSRVTADVESLQNTITDTLERVLLNVATILIFGSILFGLSFELALITLAPLPMYSVLILLYNHKVRPYYTMARERIADISALLQDNLSGIRVIKCFAREGHELSRFTQKCKAFLDISITLIKIRVGLFSLGPLDYFNGPSPHPLLRRAADHLGRPHHRHPLCLSKLSLAVLRPRGSLTRINDTIVRAAASARRIFEILDTQPEIKDAPKARAFARLDGYVEFQNVVFAYERGPAVLNDVSFAVQPGQLIGLVGPSGAGKTTMINLICRFYDPDAGAVRVDGRDLKKTCNAHPCAGKSAWSCKSHSSSTAPSAKTSPTANSTPPKRHHQRRDDGQRTRLCLQLSRCLRHAHRRAGVRLSGGEKQRISIARAILNDPRILILDEATSSVDTETEMLIQKALERLMAGRTTFAIAHRLSTVRRADCLYVHRPRQNRGIRHPCPTARQRWLVRSLVRHAICPRRKSHLVGHLAPHPKDSPMPDHVSPFVPAINLVTQHQLVPHAIDIRPNGAGLLLIANAEETTRRSSGALFSLHKRRIAGSASAMKPAQNSGFCPRSTA